MYINVIFAYFRVIKNYSELMKSSLLYEILIFLMNERYKWQTF